MATLFGSCSPCLLIDRAGRCLLWMNAVGITYEDASQLAAALRVPIDPNWKENRTRGWLAREFPGSTSRIEAHPFLGGAFVIAATVLILIGIALDPDWLRRAFGSCTPKPNRTARRSSAERSGGGALSNR